MDIYVCVYIHTHIGAKATTLLLKESSYYCCYYYWLPTLAVHYMVGYSDCWRDSPLFVCLKTIARVWRRKSPCPSHWIWTVSIVKVCLCSDNVGTPVGWWTHTQYRVSNVFSEPYRSVNGPGHYNGAIIYGLGRDQILKARWLNMADTSWLCFRWEVVVFWLHSSYFNWWPRGWELVSDFVYSMSPFSDRPSSSM